MDKSRATGPKPDRLRLDGDWAEQMGDALNREVPPEGVPDPPGKGTRPKRDKGSRDDRKPESNDDD
ncbi:MAG: hypothetical protein AAF356_11705 [Planctomycetota bacterium]